MYGEEPGIFSEWPIIPIKWAGNLFNQQPKENSTAVRYSWFVKSLSISLAERGANLHLKSIVKGIEGDQLNFYGAGYLGTGQMKFDRIIDFRTKNSKELWYGGVTISKTDTDIFGIRPDQTIEIWSKNENIGDNLIQKMQWHGQDPRTALIGRVNLGINTAESSLYE
jgi:hypothetical protein